MSKRASQSSARVRVCVACPRAHIGSFTDTYPHRAQNTYPESAGIELVLKYYQ
eukprot:COSAG03_NODE_11980_length_567_cov_1.021368_1_plen_52_part_10